jgi:hypothetical protein
MFTIRKASPGEEHLPAARGAIQVNHLCGVIIKRDMRYASIQAEIAKDMNRYS